MPLLYCVWQELSRKNTDNRQKQKARHMAGSKSYSQISYEKVLKRVDVMHLCTIKFQGSLFDISLYL